MGLSNSQYDSIIRRYEEARDRNRRLSRERSQHVYEAVPGYQELEASVGSLSVAYGKKYLNGEDDALTELKVRLKDLSAAKARLLTTAGLPADYLEPVYDCKDCQDTGYIDGQKCHCLKQSIITLLYEQSGIRQMLASENFDALTYDYFEGEDLPRFQNTVTACNLFLKNFVRDYQNLFFYGTVGTGKSFLSGCIAKTLIENGHSVIYFSAAGLFEALSLYSFDYRNKENRHDMYVDLYSCDLLIIDDLGTELTNNFVASQLFSCLNERHMARKATIVSTNLSLEELRMRYSERIFSRITSHYQLFKFSGPDIRMLKKRMYNRK